jgi:hypothetical protein
VIDALLGAFSEIRYVAVYEEGELFSRQRNDVPDHSSADSDRYEELLVNPVLLTAARQRGNIDCGGLRFLVIAYGNFFQLVKETPSGHISICLDKGVNLTALPDRIFEFLKSGYPELVRS